VATVFTVEGLQATWTEVIVEGDAWTVTAVLPDFAASCTLVAVTVTVPPEAGAVKSPLASTVPPLTDHVTAAL
jgi:hypothetical protein